MFAIIALMSSPAFSSTLTAENPSESDMSVESATDVSDNISVTFQKRWSNYQKKYVIDITNNTGFKIWVSYQWSDGDEWHNYRLTINAHETDRDNPGGIDGDIRNVKWDFVKETERDGIWDIW